MVGWWPKAPASAQQASDIAGRRDACQQNRAGSFAAQQFPRHIAGRVTAKPVHLTVPVPTTLWSATIARRKSALVSAPRPAPSGLLDLEDRGSGGNLVSN